METRINGNGNVQGLRLCSNKVLVANINRRGNLDGATPVNGGWKHEIRVIETDQNEMNNSPTDAMDPIVFASDRMVNRL